MSGERIVYSNKNSNLVMQVRDKGKKIFAIDKETERNKVQQQIDGSSFKTSDHDLNSNHIKIVSEWANKWFRKGEISEDWRNYIITEDAQPGKNSALYKSHKQYDYLLPLAIQQQKIYQGL